MRETIASAIMNGLRRYSEQTADIQITGRTITSDLVLELRLTNGDVHNITISKAKTG